MPEKGIEMGKRDEIISRMSNLSSEKRKRLKSPFLREIRKWNRNENPKGDLQFCWRQQNRDCRCSTHPELTIGFWVGKNGNCNQSTGAESKTMCIPDDWLFFFLSLFKIGTTVVRAPNKTKHKNKLFIFGTPKSSPHPRSTRSAPKGTTHGYAIFT